MSTGVGKIYSTDKLAWHTDKVAALRKGRHIPLTHIQLVISDHCNQHCNFCAYRMPEGFSSENFKMVEDGKINVNPYRLISLHKCVEILADAVTMGVKAVQFTGGGEPTVHPDHIAIFDFAQALGLETALVTNGTRIKNLNTLERMTWIRVSLDAGTAETYERTRRSKLWPTVMRNLEALARLKGPTIGIGFVITKYNWEEIIRATQLIRSFGFKYIRLSAVFSSEGSGYYKDIYNSILDTINVAKTLETDDFKIIDLFGNRIADLDQGRPDYAYCGYQRFTTYIGGDQKIYRCCTNAYTPFGCIGDLTNQRLINWFNNEAKAAFDELDAHNCHHCQFNDKNKLINYLVDNNPEHVNFV